MSARHSKAGHLPVWDKKPALASLALAGFLVLVARLDHSHRGPWKEERWW